MRLKDSFSVDSDGLSQALRMAERFADRTAASRGARTRLLLVVEEVLANVIAHGAAPREGWMDLDLAFTKARIEIRVTDAGVPFDPRVDLPTASRDAAVQAGIEGGAGWPMILEWCEIAGYERDADRNHLILSLALGE